MDSLTPNLEPWSHHSCSPTGAFCIPLYVPYVLTGRWTFGRGLCKLWLVVDYLLCASSVFNIVLISYDRFLSVTRAVSSGVWTLEYTMCGRTLGRVWLLPGCRQMVGLPPLDIRAIFQ